MIATRSNAGAIKLHEPNSHPSPDECAALDPGPINAILTGIALHQRALHPQTLVFMGPGFAAARRPGDGCVVLRFEAIATK
jgi:hypothetical protein